MNLTEREKKLLIVVGALLIATLLFFAVKYVKDSFFRFATNMEDLKAQERTLDQLGAEYQNLKNLKSGKNINLDNMALTVENILKAHGIYELTKINPADNIIEKKYKKRTLRIIIQETTAIDILKFINDIERQTGIPMVIDKFSMVPILKKTGMYRVSLSISSFQDMSKGVNSGP